MKGQVRAAATAYFMALPNYLSVILGAPSLRSTCKGTHPPKLQALLHDRVGREEDQKPMRHHTSDIAWKYHSCGSGKA